MQSADYIIHSKWLLTCEAHFQTLEDHALILKNGLIEDILPSTQATERYTARDTIHYTTHAVLPGLINAHTHVGMQFFRGLADDLALMDWLNNHIWPAEQRWLNHDFVYAASQLAIAEMIRSGTTCFNDMYFFLPATAQAATQAGIRAHIGLTIIDLPTSWAKTTEEYFSKGLAFLDEYRNHPLITPTLAPHALYTVAESSLTRIGTLAEDYNLKINIHLHETKDEIYQSIATTKERPLRRLHNIGLVSPRLNAVHMTEINEEDLTLLLTEKPTIINCPESNMKLASGFCPVEKLRAYGLNVALGTDSVASNNDLDMLGEMRSATLLGKLGAFSPQALSAEAVLKMATLNGAKALGIDHLTGSLTKGKAADFIAIDLDELETLPLYHPASQIVYAASREQIKDVWVAGKRLLKNRSLLTMDEHSIKHNSKLWQSKMNQKQ